MPHNQPLKNSELSVFPASGKLPYSLTNDYMFRAVLQENNNGLKHLIAALLDIPYKDISSCVIINPIILGESFGSKTVIMDIRILLNNNRLINLEMQMGSLAFWPNRSLLYLCRLFSNLSKGADYDQILPSVHIGILPHPPFPGVDEFYSEYLMMNQKNLHVFTRNFSLRMLCLNQLENVSEEVCSSELYPWAKLFSATTWEEIHMLARNSETIKNTAITMYQLSAEEKIRLQCEARERYEHDQASLIREGNKQGHKKGIEQATEQINKLAQLLHSDGRIDDFFRSTTDHAFQQELLKEYHLLITDSE
ncbi:MAG: Rpn family recombination-promoting nuclease/putative transposase [Lachnospiraceae bacterium]|nr:Rpn family recombination-promoting nuclease/putative transposase [Lachnospiraceae bacterium]